jgi:hypothetical protein
MLYAFQHHLNVHILLINWFLTYSSVAEMGKENQASSEDQSPLQFACSLASQYYFKPLQIS